MDQGKEHPPNKIQFIKYLFPAFLLFHLFFGWSTNMLYSQEKNLPGQFQKARQLAYDQETQKARQICLDILSENPEYHDVRVLLARTLIWESKYDSARKELKTVYEKMPEHFDCIHEIGRAHV